jgi:hypothetical protein
VYSLVGGIENMTEEEIRNIVREECSQIMTDAGLTDNDVIIKKEQPLSEQESAQHGFTSLEVVKRIGKIAIMVGKKGAKAVAIVVFILGLWEFAQFGSMFVFEKRLPDAVDLALRARQGVIELAYDVREQDPNTPEKWIVTSPSWERYEDAQYKNMVHEYLSGKRPPEELYATDTQFIATSVLSIEVLSSTSSSSEDFEV